MRGFKSFLPFVLLFVCLLQVDAQKCVNAGRDTAICMGDISLTGTPALGTWTYLCKGNSLYVSIVSTNGSTIRYRPSKCGYYDFIYKSTDPNCNMQDTVTVFFDQVNFATELVTTQITVVEQPKQCHVSPLDSCGIIRIVAGQSKQHFQWKTNMYASSRQTFVNPLFNIVDTNTCISAGISHPTFQKTDSVRFIRNISDGLKLDSFYNQPISQLSTFLLQEYNELLKALVVKFPSRDCGNILPGCLDTIFEQKLITVPSYKGGAWHIIHNNDTLLVVDDFQFVENGITYLLRITPSNSYYGPDDIQVRMFQLDGGGKEVPLQTDISVHLIWRENWINEQLFVRIPKSISSVRCKCAKPTTTFNPIQFNLQRATDCPPIRLVFNPIGKTSIEGNTSFCPGGSTILTAPDGFISYQWSTNDTAKQIEVDTAGTYVLFAEKANGCRANDTVVVSQRNQPSYDIAQNVTAVCDGDCAFLEVKTDRSNIIIWNQNDTAQILKVCPTNNTQYHFRVIDTFACDVIDSIQIDVNDRPKPDAGPTHFITCANQSIQIIPVNLDLSNTRTFYWQGPGITSGNEKENNPIINKTGTYYVYVEDTISNCIGIDSVIVEYDTIAPKAHAGFDQLINCESREVFIDASQSELSGNGSLEWSGPAITILNNKEIKPKINQAGAYIVKISNTRNGCFAFDTVDVFEDLELPNADAGTDRIIPCDSTQITLGGPNITNDNSARIIWSGPGITISQRNKAYPVVSDVGLYQVIVIDESSMCRDTDFVEVRLPNIYPQVILDKSNDLGCGIKTASIMSDQSIGEHLNYAWRGIGIIQNNTQSILINQPGWYTLLLTDSLTKCTSIDSVFVPYIGEKPQVFAGSDVVITCETKNGEISLQPFVNIPIPRSEIQWTGPGVLSGNERVFNAIVNKPGTYILTITDAANKCSSSDSVDVVERLNIAQIDAGRDMMISCDSLQVVINGNVDPFNPNHIKEWSGPGIDPLKRFNTLQIVDKEGEYVFGLYPPNPSCNVYDTLIVRSDTAKVRFDLKDSIAYPCGSNSVTINLNINTNFKSIVWSSAPGGNYILSNDNKTIDVIAGGRYYVEVTGNNGCKTKDTVLVQANLPLIYEVLSFPSCPNRNSGEILVIIKQGNRPVLTSINNSVFTEDVSYRFVMPGANKLQLKDANGCLYEENINVTEHVALPDNISEKIEKVICDVVILNALEEINVPAKVQWRSGETTPSIQVNSAGPYYVQISDSNNCKTIERLFDVVTIDKPINEIIKLPNVFMPLNASALEVNRTYKPYIIPDFDVLNYELDVYDRWGKNVFNTINNYEYWDGTYKGETLPADSYMVMVRGMISKCGQEKPFSFKSMVTLVK